MNKIPNGHVKTKKQNIDPVLCFMLMAMKSNDSHLQNRSLEYRCAADTSVFRWHDLSMISHDIFDQQEQHWVYRKGAREGYTLKEGGQETYQNVSNF